MKDRNNKYRIDCVDWSIASSRKSVAPWRGTSKQEYQRKEKEKRKEARRGVLCLCQRYVQKREQRQRIENAGRQRCQVVVEEISVRYQRMKILDSWRQAHCHTPLGALKPSVTWWKERRNKGNRQAVRWCHVNIPASSIVFFFFHTLAPLSWLQAKRDQCHTKLDVITIHNEEKKITTTRRRRRKGLCFFLSIRPFI